MAEQDTVERTTLHIAEQAAFLKSILESSTEYSIIAKDLNGTILAWNEGARRIYGHEASDVVGKASAFILHDPEDVKSARAQAILDEARKAGKWEGDLKRVRKNGNRFTAHVTITLCRSPAGEAIGFTMISGDLMESERIERELRESKEYNRGLIESNIDALMTTDPLGTITDVNRQMYEMTGFGREQLIGTPFKNYFTDPQRAEDGIRKVLPESRVTNYELTIRSKSGKETVVSYNAATFKGADGRLRGVFAAARDITDQKRLEEPTTRHVSVRYDPWQAISRRHVANMIYAACAWSLALVAAFVCIGEPSHAAMAPRDLAELSLEELMNIEVTSVSKKTERLSDAAAAIFVITREDIRRSGYTSIPEILRLAPNLQVARVDSSQYAITARGFNSTIANKLLVLIDGRSVYTPFFSGVFWDMQDTLIEDIERIEVISGPGGTLWGSNAVNGVINIITRRSQDTKGALVSLGAGTEELGAGVRYGAKLGENATLRVYGKGFNRDNTVRGNGTNVEDSWKKGQVGFRTDWGRGSDALTLQGDGYTGTIDQVGNDKSISGANLLARWNRTLEGGSALQVQGYFDRTRRVQPGTFGELLDTYDIEAQHRFKWGARHEIVWGGGYRLMHDAVTNSAVLAFLPNVRVLHLANGFLQDSIALRERLHLTLGVKLESNSYTGLEVQPNARLAWKFRDDALLWSAVSRVVRTPSRVDRDLFAPGTGPPFTTLAGGPDFKSEKLIAYEIGYRAQPVPHASLSISTFYNVYDDLRSVEPGPGGPPSVLANKMEGHTYGVETWGSYHVLDWWRLSAGYNYLKENLGFKADSRDSNIAAAGNDPAHQFSARSAMNLAHNLEWDAGLRVIGALGSPDVPKYVTLDTRLGWAFMKGVELSLIGYNLLDHDHPEFGAAPNRSELARAFYAKIVWSY